jgi:hypothetical protein
MTCSRRGLTGSVPLGARGLQQPHTTNTPAAPDGLAPSELKVSVQCSPQCFLRSLIEFCCPGGFLIAEFFGSIQC